MHAWLHLQAGHLLFLTDLQEGEQDFGNQRISAGSSQRVSPGSLPTSACVPLYYGERTPQPSQQPQTLQQQQEYIWMHSTCVGAAPRASVQAHAALYSLHSRCPQHSISVQSPSCARSPIPGPLTALSALQRSSQCEYEYADLRPCPHYPQLSLETVPAGCNVICGPTPSASDQPQDGASLLDMVRQWQQRFPHTMIHAERVEVPGIATPHAFLCKKAWWPGSGAGACIVASGSSKKRQRV